MFETIARASTSAAQRLRVRSALNPILWADAIVLPLTLASAYLFRADPLVARALLLLAALPVLVTCGVFIYFAVTGPEKLQSEEYQIRHEALQLIQQKAGVLLLDPTSLTAITNPEMRALPPSKSEGL